MKFLVAKSLDGLEFSAEDLDQYPSFIISLIEIIGSSQTHNVRSYLNAMFPICYAVFASFTKEYVLLHLMI
jgi:hypothetical protein